LSTRHIHLDPVGGIAGDMFVAAMLDTFPESLQACLQDLEHSGVLAHVVVSLQVVKSHGLAAKRFSVTHISDSPRATGQYRDIVQMLCSSALQAPVRERALCLLEILAQAESQVHGVKLDDVHFHEVADWDSITDIVAAASVIEHNEIASWSCSALPLGSGLVKTEHGMLPVPAPATQVLLEGLTVWDDGESGERVTPTGAAIVRYLADTYAKAELFAQRPFGVSRESGAGAGQRALQTRPNIVRCSVIETLGNGQIAGRLNSMRLTKDALVLDTTHFEHDIDHVVQLNFAIDDMSSEEMAVALQFLRQSDGVIDISHSISYGKKGRMVFDVTVLCEPEKEPTVSRRCFSETSTLGMRVQLVPRRILTRFEICHPDDNSDLHGKGARRPCPDDTGEQTTVKIDSDDLRRVPGLQARRKRTLQFEQAQYGDVGRSDKGSVDAGRVDDARVDDARVGDARVGDARVDGARVDGARVDGARVDGGSANESGSRST